MEDPHASCAIAGNELISRGMHSCWYGEGWPSLPAMKSSFCPHVHTTPVSVSAALMLQPAATARTELPSRPKTTLGLERGCDHTWP
eukprot:4767834-Prymnesium_polylepis.2